MLHILAPTSWRGCTRRCRLSGPQTIKISTLILYMHYDYPWIKCIQLRANPSSSCYLITHYWCCIESSAETDLSNYARLTRSTDRDRSKCPRRAQEARLKLSSQSHRADGPTPGRTERSGSQLKSRSKVHVIQYIQKANTFASRFLFAISEFWLACEKPLLGILCLLTQVDSRCRFIAVTDG